jgi:hypothetical protein
MADLMVDLWKDTAIRFKWKVLDYLKKEDIQEQDRKKIERIRDVMSGFIQDTKKPSTLYTQDNLVLLVKCWEDFCAWTDGVDHWHKEFPEWSFMISQFQVFVNQSVVNQMMMQGTADKIYNSQTINGILGEIAGIKEELKGVEKKMKGMEANITTTTSSIEDLGVKMTTTTSSIKNLEGRVKELERPWYSRSGKKKAGSGSGERMVDLLEDLEKLSCSEKREED